jgi:hypothetical protein
MDDDGPADAARGLHDQIHLVLRERRRRFAVRPGAVVAVHLDPIGAMARLVAHDLDERLPIGFLSACGIDHSGENPFGA